MKEASFYKKNDDGSVSCILCHRFCRIAKDSRGFCGVRLNKDGVLYSLNYGRAIAVAIDPIEKKPFYHFMPSSLTFSFATVGCNFKCLYCQNWDISQYRELPLPGEELLPEDIVKRAEAVDGIAYTYTEPTIFMEYALDTAVLARKKGLFNVFVTNGYMSDEAIKEMKGKIDASRIDLKGFNQKIYSEVMGNASLEVVLENIKKLHKIMHIEIINLVIPGLNDREDELRALAEFVKDVDPNIPLHFTGFYPAYKMQDVPPTPLETLRRAREIALDVGVRYVYTGNRLDSEGESTYCYNCGKLLIKRMGFRVERMQLEGDKCVYCGKKQYLVVDIKEYWKKRD